MKLSELEILIDKYLSGQATEEEKAIITRWLEHNPEDRIADPQKRQELISAIWENVFSAIQQPAADSNLPHHRSGIIRGIGWLQKKYMIRVAASLLFVAMTGVLFHYFFRGNTSSTIQYASVSASDSAAMEHLLPDGSKAWLFPGSSIRIPDNYNAHDRQVQITGRAYFDVKRDTSKPFFVNAGTLQTRVLGTSFEVNTLRQQYPSVVVKTGRVGVSWEGKELTQLTPDKRITLDLSGNQLQSTIDSVNAAALCTWWTGVFNFEQTPLTEVVQNLSEWYRIAIHIQGDQWKKEKVTVQIETHLSLDETMRLLCETLGTQYTKKDRQIFLN